MKKQSFIIFFPFVLFSVFVLSSCSSYSEYERVIRDYLQTHKGIKTDLEIEFLSLSVNDILVSDSITILQNQFEAEKALKIESIQSSIIRLQNKIQEQKGKKNQVVAKALISGWEKEQERLQSELTNAQNCQADYLNRYEERNANDVLAKKADCRFSFMNPRLQSKQEVKALFILSADGKKCNKMIKQ